MAKLFNNNVLTAGDLNGNYEDVLNYLSWTINTRANRYFNSLQKGTAFLNAVKTLKDKYGVEVSTHFLNQLVDRTKIKKSKRHILHLLKMSGFCESGKDKNRYMLKPIAIEFKGYKSLLDGTHIFSYTKKFDFLVFPNDWNMQEAQAETFKQKCLSEWNEKRQILEREQIEADKLKMVSTLEEKPIDYQELEDVSPHLVKTDITLMPKWKGKRSYH